MSQMLEKCNWWHRVGDGLNRHWQIEKVSVIPLGLWFSNIPQMMFKYWFWRSHFRFIKWSYVLLPLLFELLKYSLFLSKVFPLSQTMRRKILFCSFLHRVLLRKCAASSIFCADNKGGLFQQELTAAISKQKLSTQPVNFSTTACLIISVAPIVLNMCWQLLKKCEHRFMCC